MDKPFYKSLTFWGAIGLGVAVTLQQLGVDWPVVLPIAEALFGILGAMGIRRAIK